MYYIIHLVQFIGWSILAKGENALSERYGSGVRPYPRPQKPDLQHEPGSSLEVRGLFDTIS